MSPFPGTKHDVHVDDIVMSTCRTQGTDAARNLQDHDGNVEVRRLDQAGKSDLLWAAPSLCHHTRWDAQRSSATPQLIQTSLH
jgi:hypothetical protein